LETSVHENWIYLENSTRRSNGLNDLGWRDIQLCAEGPPEVKRIGHTHITSPNLAHGNASIAVWMLKENLTNDLLLFQCSQRGAGISASCRMNQAGSMDRYVWIAKYCRICYLSAVGIVNGQLVAFDCAASSSETGNMLIAGTQVDAAIFLELKPENGPPLTVMLDNDAYAIVMPGKVDWYSEHVSN
jgi:hypothetical protein